MKIKKIYKHFLILFVVALFLEIFIFNFRFYETLGYEERVLNDIKLNDGLELLNYNSEKENDISYKYKDDGAVIEIIDSGQASFELLDIDEEVKNIYIDLKKTNKNQMYSGTVTYNLYATDEANKLYFKLPQREIAYNVDKSNYVSLNLSGKSEKIKIKIVGEEGDIYVLSQIKINVQYPMRFSFVRFISVFVIMFVMYLIRPKSPAYRIILDLKSVRQKVILEIVIAFHILSFIAIALLNPSFVKPSAAHQYQYHQLTDAILDGHVYLDIEPSPTLKEMENPYDSNYRRQLLKMNGEKFLWDRAYYNGKYYVYFGVVPVLTMYLPFKIITGMHFPTVAGIIVVSVLLIFAVLGLVHQVIKRWFNESKVPFVVYTLLSFMFIDGCGVIYILKRPDFYSLPILMAVLLSVSGLYFWISSLKKSKIPEDLRGEQKETEEQDKYEDKTEEENKDYTIIKWRLFVGSLCMAAVAGCRPQLILGSFLAIPIFWEVVFKERKMFSKKSISETILFCIPYILFAVGIMWYNYIRFDSPFDYGANYNLTTNDMTQRGFVLGRTFLGIFMYLFEPPVYSPRFPFISDVWFYTNYMGRTIKELMYGGVIFNHLILASNFLVFRFKNKLKAKGLFAFSIICLASAAVIVIADTQVAGILFRYMADFSWLLFLSATVIMLLIVEIIKPSLRKHVYSFIMGTCIFSFIYSFATVFFIGDSTIDQTNPEVFYQAAYLIQFWL